MTPANAPIYVRLYDLALWILGQTATWPATTHAILRVRIDSAAIDLLDAAARSLTFPALRDKARDRADLLALRLRLLLRLACGVARLSPRQLRFACGEIDAVGRMIGGWKRKAQLRRFRKRGSKPKAAPTA